MERQDGKAGRKGRMERQDGKQDRKAGRKVRMERQDGKVGWKGRMVR